MLPRWAYLSFGLLAAGSVALGYWQKNHEHTRGHYAQVLSEQIEPGFAAYVLGYSGGVQSRVAPVRVRFTAPVRGAQAGKAAEAGLLYLAPAEEGKLVWEDAQTLVFTPKEPFAFGETHRVHVDLGKLMPVEEGYERFKFSFITPRQGARIRHLTWVEKGTALEGQVVLADYEKGAKVEGAFAADLMPEGSYLRGPVAWKHSPDGKTHTFRIDDVLPDHGGQEVRFRIKKNLPGLDNLYEFSTKLPTAGTFALWNVEETSGPDREIVLSFTNDIDPKQDLSGMVSLEGFPALRAWAEGSRIHVAMQRANRNAADNGNEGDGEEVAEDMAYAEEGDREVNAQGRQFLRVGAGLRSASGEALPADVRSEIMLEPGKPSLRLVETGMVLPPQEGGKMLMPFEAIGLKQASVTVYRIEPANRLQFLQSINEYRGNQNAFNLKSLGRPVGGFVVNLAAAGYADAREWHKYRADLTPWMSGHSGAFHFVQIRFDQSMVDWACGEKPGAGSLLTISPFGQEENLDSFDGDGYDGYSYDYEGEYDYSESGNPCNPAFYSNYATTIGQYLVASNLGMTAKKQSDGALRFAFTNLKTGQPESGVELYVYSKQSTLLGSRTSSMEGFAQWDRGNSKAMAYTVLARKGDDYAYLKVENSQALNTAGFDVGGSESQNGDRAFLYTERGVYRPGDTLHVGSMLEGEIFKRSQRLPQVLELENPSNQMVARIVRLAGKENHARYDIPTAADWPTGVYTLRLRSGGLTETKSIAIETVKPNRLKVDLKPIRENMLAGTPMDAQLASRWLFGAPAAGFRYQIEGRVLQTPWRPAGYDAFGFTDVTRDINLPEDRLNIAEGKLDEQGNATVELEAKLTGLDRPIALGMTTTVTESGGDFSTDFTRIFLHPYTTYMGISTSKEGEEGRYQSFETGKPVSFRLVNLNPLTGKPAPAPEVNVRISRLDWVWWWQERSGSYVYVNNSTEKLYKEETISLDQGTGSYSFSTEVPQWGRYLIKVTNPASGHTASTIVYIGYPSDDEWQDPDMLTRIGLSVNKKSYKPGEVATVTCGKDVTGTHALVSLERGGRVLDQFWAEPKGPQGAISIPIKPEHGPNTYAWVSLMRPHGETRASKPIRRYGVVSLPVVSDVARLKPTIALPEYARPNSTLKVKVAEEKGRTMSYMVMMVDEGLLDLTRFRTPDPYEAFYGRLALEVRTFDMYGDVISAGALESSRLAVTGGDAEAKEKAEEARNKLRFEAVSRMYGPFVLKPGTTAEHSIPMPEYTGSVRMMVVASSGQGAAYGSAEKALPVRSELILNGSAPRFLLPGDKALLGLSAEFMKKGLTQAEVTVAAKGNARIEGGKSTIGKEALFFPLTAGSPGIAEITATGKAGEFTSRWRATVPIQSGTRPVLETELVELKPGEQKALNLALIGQANSDAFTLEASPGLPFPLRRSLDYLIHYPYGCAEQTLSATVAQMLLPGAVKLDSVRLMEINRNVEAGLTRLSSFKTATGGLALWPGSPNNHSWATAYALHACKLAKARGYTAGGILGEQLEGYVAMEARAYNYSSINEAEQVLQAYRLYALSPHNVEEMNRLLQVGNLAPQAYWLLAAALAEAGRGDEAAKAMASQNRQPESISGGYDIFYSGYRDQALILFGMNAIHAPTDMTLPLARQLASELARNPWANTQEIIWSLLALEPYLANKDLRGVNVATSVGGKTMNLSANAGPAMLDLGRRGGELQVTNKGKAACFVTLTHRYEPMPGAQKALSEGLGVSVAYVDNKGNPVSLADLKQGQNVQARITVQGLMPGIYMDNLALTWFAPAGFEIRNDRLQTPEESGSRQFEHQDIRDDKVRWFFSLGQMATKTFTIPLTAAYPGSFTLPSTTVEDMYHPERRASTAAGRVGIVQEGGH